MSLRVTNYNAYISKQLKSGTQPSSVKIEAICSQSASVIEERKQIHFIVINLSADVLYGSDNSYDSLIREDSTN